MSNQKRVWSKLQVDIFNHVKNGTGNAIVEAVAGSGKTTTIVEAMKLVQGSAIFLAFNKSIAEELKSRGVNARTFHSLTYAPVTRAKETLTVDSNKLRKLCDMNMRGKEASLYSAFCCRLVGLGKQCGLGALVPDVHENWLSICIHHDLEPEAEEANLARGIELASDLLTWSNESSSVDFDDLLYLPVKDGISLPKYDFIFVDEAQDTNAIQRAILRKIMKPTSRLVAVGDPHQAIYGFRGSDSDSLGILGDEFDCVTLPLSISYRCGQKIVEYAQQWVEHIQAAPNAPEGEVVHLGSKWKPEIFNAGDLVVCRRVAPLLSLAYRMLRDRQPVTIMGRESGSGLKSLITKMKTDNLDVLVEKLEAWTLKEVERAVAKMNDGKVEALQDKFSAIQALVESMDEGSQVADLLMVIDNLFENKDNATLLATIHKAKGLEAEVVYWLGRNQCPAKWAKRNWQKQQEVNLCYVATTRAISKLVTLDLV